MKNPKLIIGIIAIIVLLIIFYLLWKSSQKVEYKTGTTVTTQPGLLDTLLGIFAPKGTSTSTSTTPGQPLYCAIFPRLCQPKPTTYCDCDRPGYASDGVPDENCNEGRMLWEQSCA